MFNTLANKGSWLSHKNCGNGRLFLFSENDTSCYHQIWEHRNHTMETQWQKILIFPHLNITHKMETNTHRVDAPIYNHKWALNGHALH